MLSAITFTNLYRRNIFSKSVSAKKNDVGDDDFAIEYFLSFRLYTYLNNFFF